ncbi:MAG: YceI family protein [Saprospiraceae bacterium]|nr:YceI family protein [Saprospiraceae bacterium]
MLIVLFVACQRTPRFEPDPVGPPLERELGSFSKPVQWYVDTTHSSLLFRTRHTAVHDVVGWVQSYRIAVTAQRYDFSDAQIDGRFDMRTLTMPNPEMADNVMSINFVHSDSFPQAWYRSRKIKYTGINTFEVEGDLTLKGRTHPVKLNAQFNGFANLGHTLPGFTIEGRFSRFDFGISQRDTLKPGAAPMVDDTIYITGNFRLYHE